MKIPATQMDMNYINIAESIPSTLEGTLNELLEYPEYLLPFMSQLVGLKEQYQAFRLVPILIILLVIFYVVRECHLV